MSRYVLHLKLRTLSQDREADHEIVQIRMDEVRVPQVGEKLNLPLYPDSGRGNTVPARITSVTEEQGSESPIRFVVLADELDGGNPPGHREATAADLWMKLSLFAKHGSSQLALTARRASLPDERIGVSFNGMLSPRGP